MKAMKFLLLAACITGVSFAQDAAATKPSSGILGYLDPQTGAFRPVQINKSAPSEVPAVTPTTGKFVFNVSIAVNPGLASSAKITCSAGVSVGEPSNFTGFGDTVVATATRSGGTAACTINVPYGWYLQTPTKDTVVISVTVSADAGTLGTPPYSIGSSLQELSIAVPASGATTTEAINTAI